MKMARNGLSRAVRVMTFSAAPLVAALVLAGPSTADATTPHAIPVAGIPLQKSEDVATNPHALIPDPILNGSSVGGSIGSAVGSATGSAGSLIGGAIGALVGYLHPEVIPQVLP
ncbi:glycine zipper domain-containing protein [Nocardia sp. CA-290969]|uniref:glycine zipper domain-containing protein n=1 Tax=Nocardia sp. CA-290969 TaxID=3239986 RepID=UPI003D93DF9A